VEGTGFVHEFFEQRAPIAGDVEVSAAPLYIFLEGDGRPWNDRGTAPRRDPDAVRAVGRDLAALHAGPAILLGRPCYHGRASDAGCEPTLWTYGRYSEVVVASMATAVQRLAALRNADAIVLVGFSGGGVLALLVADRVPTVKAVVTLAANLDLVAWTRYHGYLQLAGSLDPLAVRTRRVGCEIHVAGARDVVVPVTQTSRAVARRPGAVLWIEPDADHACCWASGWPTMAQRIAEQFATAGCLSASS
jgi:pimeloyl-ACP methyl ester carboxylesterase